MIARSEMTWRGAALVGLLTACTSGSEATCFPGATQPCVCPGARIGAQSCGDDGRRWNACECTVATSGGDAGGSHDDDDDDDDDDDAVGHDAAMPDTGEAGPVETPDVTRGAAVYARYCESCHGPTGTGTRNGPNIRNESRKQSDRELAELILEGKDDMPALELTAQEIVDVTVWLRATFGPYRP